MQLETYQTISAFSSSRASCEAWIESFGDLRLEDVGGGDHCQFRVISGLVYNSPAQYQFVRNAVTHYMRNHSEEFAITFEDSHTRILDLEGHSISAFNSLEEYCHSLEHKEWGNELTLRVAAAVYGVAFQILKNIDGVRMIEVIGETTKENPVPLVLALYGEDHYVLVRSLHRDS